MNVNFSSIGGGAQGYGAAGQQGFNVGAPNSLGNNVNNNMGQQGFNQPAGMSMAMQQPQMQQTPGQGMAPTYVGQPAPGPASAGTVSQPVAPNVSDAQVQAAVVRGIHVVAA